MAEELSADEKAALDRIRADKEKARKLACLDNASKVLATAVEALTGISHDSADEARIAVMNLLRQAIDHVNEAG